MLNLPFEMLNSCWTYLTSCKIISKSKKHVRRLHTFTTDIWNHLNFCEHAKDYSEDLKKYEKSAKPCQQCKYLLKVEEHLWNRCKMLQIVSNTQSCCNNMQNLWKNLGNHKACFKVKKLCDEAQYDDE
jgi:hypothetical protein